MGTQKGSEQLVFGLDIGTRSVVGTVGYKQNARDFVVVAQTTKCHETRAMLDGQIHDIAQVAMTVSEVKHELEKKIGKKLTDVCIAAAGRVLKTNRTRTEYEIGDEVTVTPELIRQMELIGVEQAHAELRKSGSECAGYFCVGYSIVKYYMDGIAITNLEGHKASKIGAEILATFLPQDVIDGLYETTKRAGLNVINLTLEPIAAINLAIPEKFRLLNLALVDVGAGTSDICITKDGSVTAYGMLPCAGDYITEVIMQELLVEFKTAETIKLALSSNRKKISYTDIMGLKYSRTKEEMQKIVEKPLSELAKKISEKIVALNGGKQVSAIFIVGGGGKNPYFTPMLASSAKLPKERVALRGEEVLTTVSFLEEKVKKDPMLVTPIGICLNYYEQYNNFIFAKVNDELVKLYDNGRLSVLDAAMALGTDSVELFPKRGKELCFTVNGEKRVIRGEAGEAAVITVNGKPASIATPIARNDEIRITDSTAGEAAHATIGELNEVKKSITFIVNGRRLTCPRLVMVNDSIVSELYEISTNDEISVLDYYTVEKLFEYMDVKFNGSVKVNNLEAFGNEKVFENFSVEFGCADENEALLDKKDKKLQDKKDAHAASIVIVNGTSVLLTGKNSYRLVDVLDFYQFDTKTPHGSRVVMRINGAECDFSAPVVEGDQIELFWEK